MSKPLISAALIVRNEERFIARCLASIKDVVDEMVVVDTGSTDRTPAIAAELGAQVSEFPWCDDFAAARNVAIDRSAGKWILYIDADEAVRPVPDARRRLEAMLNGRRTVGAYVQLQSKSGYTPYWEIRIFRNAPGVRFEGIIHETIWPALRAYQVMRLGKFDYSDLVLEHLGYEGPQDHKHARNQPQACLLPPPPGPNSFGGRARGRGEGRLARRPRCGAPQAFAGVRGFVALSVLGRAGSVPG
jgi:glycosyltransferase involved in cell wall biosynthesis